MWYLFLVILCLFIQLTWEIEIYGIELGQTFHIHNSHIKIWKGVKMNTKIVAVFSLLLSMSLLSCATPSKPSKAVPPDAKIVELNIPLCEWPEDERGIRVILKSTEGVYDAHASGLSSSVKIWYDEKRTNVDAFIKILKDNNYEVSGTPKFLN